MAQETYFYGQGEIDAAPIVNGVLGKWRWIQDVSAMSIQLAVEKVEHKESYSGQKALVRSFPSARPPPSTSPCTASARTTWRLLSMARSWPRRRAP